MTDWRDPHSTGVSKGIQDVDFGFILESNDNRRFAILFAIRCPTHFYNCRSHGKRVDPRPYWNGNKAVRG